MMLQTSAKEQLRAFVARIERLEEEKAALSADLKEVYAEAKGTGFDTKALRKIISLRKADENTRCEEEAVLATYMHALGMQADLFDEDRGEVEIRVLPDDDEDQTELRNEVADATEEIAGAAA